MDTTIPIIKAHFQLLEKCNFTAESNAESLSLRLNLLREFQCCEVKAYIISLRNKLNVCEIVDEIAAADVSEKPALEYAVRMSAVLLTLTDLLDFKTENKLKLISLQQQELWRTAISDVAQYAFKPHEFGSLYGLLRLFVEFFAQMLNVVEFRHKICNNAEILRSYVHAIFELKLAAYEGSLQLTMTNDGPISTYLDEYLTYLWTDMHKEVYFECVMSINNDSSSSSRKSSWLESEKQRQIFNKISSNGGFAAFALVMRRNAEMVAGFIATPGKTVRFQKNIINRIMSFCSLCTSNEDLPLEAGLLTLRRLYELRVENQTQIKELLHTTFEKYIKPPDILCGLIVHTHNDIRQHIQHWHQLFCYSTIACLPSAMLTDYLLLHLQLYDNLPLNMPERQLLASLVTRCLDNRDPIKELPDIIMRLYNPKFLSTWYALHERLALSCNNTEVVDLLIINDQFKREFKISDVLPKLLMTSNNNPLTYKVFMELLRLLGKLLEKPLGENNDYVLGADHTDIVDYFKAKFQINFDVLFSLNILVAHEPLIIQITEHTNEFSALLIEMLQMHLNMTSMSTEATGADTLIVLLALVREIVEKADLITSFQRLLPQLKKFKQNIKDDQVTRGITMLETLLGSKQQMHQNVQEDNESVNFRKARIDVESEEPYLQVCGIDALIKLLEEKDKAALTQMHVIIALGLKKLKQQESYIFLNCVRLFVAAVQIAESEIIELLVSEYLNDAADIDYRLVVGETIIKVSQLLGTLCYKYKGVLLNCFMDGARSQLDEYRTSAWANLGQMCRILTYQVQHFFQELMELVNAELEWGVSILAKRAAVRVLCELLSGIENLQDFAEMLLPVYRTLRFIARDEQCDDVLRQHAVNGLQTLGEKCLEMLTAKLSLEKEIKISGSGSVTANREKSKMKSFIFDLNKAT